MELDVAQFAVGIVALTIAAKLFQKGGTFLKLLMLVVAIGGFAVATTAVTPFDPDVLPIAIALIALFAGVAMIDLTKPKEGKRNISQSIFGIGLTVVAGFALFGLVSVYIEGYNFGGNFRAVYAEGLQGLKDLLEGANEVKIEVPE